MFAIIKKELKNYFFTPVGYVVICIFLFCFSLFFYFTTVSQQSVDLTYIFLYTSIYGLLFMTPIITMWTFSGEKKNGTDQILTTSSVSMFGVVFAKFLSAMMLIIIPTLLTVIYFGIICIYQMPDIVSYLTSMLGFILLGMTLVSFGLLTSSLTESPIISGILTLVLIIGTTFFPGWVGILKKYSLTELFEKFQQSQIDITAVVVYISTTLLSLIITTVIMQRRKSIK